MTRILCVGIAVVDFVFQFPVLPRTPGKHIAEGDGRGGGRHGGQRCGRGGAAWVRDAALMSRVGEDANGSFALAELDWHGLDLSAVEQAPTCRPPCPPWPSDDDGERMLFNHQDRRLLLDVPPHRRAAYRPLRRACWSTPAGRRPGVAGLRAGGRARRAGHRRPRPCDRAANGWSRRMRAASHVVFSARRASPPAWASTGSRRGHRRGAAGWHRAGSR